MSDTPLVSCIMPTRDRPQFVPHAVDYFLRQDYPAKELIVLDDGHTSIAKLLPASPLIRYIRLEQRQRVGAKRNLGCQTARGGVIMHWDDDDWMARWRLRYQVTELLAGRAVEHHAQSSVVTMLDHVDHGAVEVRVVQWRSREEQPSFGGRRAVQHPSSVPPKRREG